MNWVMDRFLCCCVTANMPTSDQAWCRCVGLTTDHSHYGVSGPADVDTSGTQETTAVGFLMEAGEDPYLNGQDDAKEKNASLGEHLIRHGRQPNTSPRPARGVQEEAVGALPGGMVSERIHTARSDTSANSASMTHEEKEKEKARLQRLVKDFAKEAVTGVAVSMVNPETARRSPHFFQMDRYLTVFSLKPKDGSLAEAAVQDFNVKDLTAIYKGVEVQVKAPSLGSSASTCVGLDTNRADRTLFFHFDDNYERDKFYTCLKILRMSVDISRPGP